MAGVAKKTSGWCFILADFEVISVIILAFIVYRQQNSCFDGFCGVWIIKLALIEHLSKNIGTFPYVAGGCSLLVWWQTDGKNKCFLKP